MSRTKRSEKVQEEREKQREFKREQQTIQQAFNADSELDRTFIEEILSSDDVTAGSADDLQEVTVAKIKSLMGRDPILANMTSAQEHDIRFKLEVLKYKVLGSHPPDDSSIKGKTRAFLYDDPMEQLEPLTQQERILIDEFFETLKTRATRGREGFERKQINTRIAQTRTEQDSNNSQKGGFTGLFD